MHAIWVKVDPWDKKLVTTALEGGADAVMVPEGFSPKVRELGRMRTIAKDGDLQLGKDVVLVEVRGQDDEESVLAAARRSRVIVDAVDWTIIPLENLIARGAEVVARVHSLEEGRTALGILEKGVWGVLIDARDPGEVRRVLGFLQSKREHIALEPVTIETVEQLGMGDRVCVDTCTCMAAGQGMLVGNASSALFLVHAESIANPYVAPRPFRVNAGPVHAYARVTEGKTRYLWELKAGDPVLIVDFEGNTHPAIVGRVKIERRPLLLVTATKGPERLSLIVQNAETIRLVKEDGSPVSVVSLEPGGKVLAALEAGGRHFGYKIEEHIEER
ncbi:3-dehydroquinate synthase II [Thermodesulfobacteriota bacterium]